MLNYHPIFLTWANVFMIFVLNNYHNLKFIKHRLLNLGLDQKAPQLTKLQSCDGNFIDWGLGSCRRLEKIYP